MINQTRWIGLNNMKQDKDILVLRAWLERLVELKEKIDKIESILVRLDEINITKKR